jgi:2-C-methyl-D-erythritol 4-phosphate cytidylyltransferase
MKADAVIVSAGKGQRLMKERKKQFLLLEGRPILCHTLDQFEACPLIHSILLVVGQEDLDYCLKEIVEKHRYRKVSQIVPGGKRRQDSVKNGIDAIPKDVEIVVIHDGVRPFITQEMIEESVQSAIRFGAVVMAMPVKETIKTAHADGTVLKTLDRESLWQIQTPQAFRVNVIKEAYRRAAEDGFVGTDDASMVERVGGKVHIVPGSYKNIKITTLEDLMLAHLFLRMEKQFQTDDSASRKGNR